MNLAGTILEAKDLHLIRGGKMVLDIPALGINEGEILSLIGPNGAGKSTLLQALAGLLKLTRGTLYFRGQGISSHRASFRYRRRLSMVFQDPLLFDTTVFGNVASGLRIRGEGEGEVKRRVAENLERFGIFHLAHRSARKISGGEAQRVALARALAIRPEILFLDEPFSSLDPPSRETLIEDLERILRQTGTTALFATHDRMEALRLSDRIAVMKEGRALQIGSPSEVMNQPVDEFVASFVGVETILTGEVTRREGGSFIASILGMEVEAVGEIHVGEQVAFCIRPENVTLTVPPRQETTSARNVFFGWIVKIVPMGLFYRVHLDCGFPLVAYVTSHSLEGLSLTAGKEIYASFKATAVHVIHKTKKSVSRSSLTGSIPAAKPEA